MRSIYLFLVMVATVQGLKQNILIGNNYSQSTQVNQLFTSYGW